MSRTDLLRARCTLVTLCLFMAGCAAPVGDSPAASGDVDTRIDFDIYDLPAEGGWTLLEVSTSGLEPLTAAISWHVSMPGPDAAAEGACIGYYVGGMGESYFIRPGGAVVGARFSGDEPVFERSLAGDRLNLAQLVVREPIHEDEKVPVLLFHSRARDTIPEADFFRWSLQAAGGVQARVVAQGSFTCATSVNEMQTGEHVELGAAVVASDVSSTVDIRERGWILLHVSADVSYSAQVSLDGRVLWQAAGGAPYTEAASLYDCCLEPGSLQVRLADFQATSPHGVSLLAFDLPPWVGETMTRDEMRKPGSSS